MSTGILIVLVTCPPATVDALAVSLVSERLAACVNIIPQVRSIYRWKDAVQKDDESLLVIKTAADRYETLKAAILARHPYELPEILAVNPAHGHAPYLDWILASTH
ncbi:MAG: divalent-cation tolerance protein CutA [Stenotrophobium sp.]